MTYQLFNRTIFLWAIAIAISLLIVNPRYALIQRVNTINGAAINCLINEDCTTVKVLLEARQYYNILSQLYPSYGRGFEMEGVCYVLLKQDKLAIKKFQEAVKHNPNLFWVDFELGKTYYRLGEYSEALKYFQKITIQDNSTLFKKAILSSLRQVSDKVREGLMLSLVEFVMDVKLSSYQMSIGCLVHQGNFTEAGRIVSKGLNNQDLDKNGFFNLAEKSLDENDSRKKMLSWIDSLAYSKPILHPWGHVIEPLKEIFLN